MMASATVELEGMVQEYRNLTSFHKRRIIVCAGTGCVAGGSREVLKAFERELAARGVGAETELSFEHEGHAPSVRLSGSGCQGFCQMGPLVRILPEDIG